MTRYISLADTANLFRRDLKAAYPAIKFSVRSSRFANGTAVHISWTDGPVSTEVARLVDRYEGSTFDGMTDLSSPRYATDENGEQIQYGAKYIQTRRDNSVEFLQKMLDFATSRWHWNEDPQYEIIPATDGYAAHVRTNNRNARQGDQWASDWFHTLCWKTSAEQLEVLINER